jgi:spore coat protein A
MTMGQEILPGLTTPIWGYNGTFPGPTIKARSNRRVVVRQTNALPEAVSVHLHGGVQTPESDGYPTDLIPPGGTKEYIYPNLHRAATLFYHDHAMDLTGPHVYKGLAGLYLISDEVEDALGLPVGEFDVPLMIQERTFNADGSFALTPNSPANVFDQSGDTILINGVPWPRLQVAAQRYRFRILNASNSTTYSVALSSRKPMVQIATDGGLLDRPISVDYITMGPAERAEVVVDFADLPLGSTVDLVDLLGTGDQAELMRFEIQRPGEQDRPLPLVLDPTEPLRSGAVERTFVFQPTLYPGFPPFKWKINGQNFDPTRMDTRVPLDSVEIWRFENRALGAVAMDHPVHVHLVNFHVLDRNGQPPAPYEAGWKDTVLVRPNETVRVIAKFAPFRGKYMLHCHNLAHEDHAMMANFEVV